MGSGVLVTLGSETLVVLLPHASYAHPAHILIGAHICLRELTVLPEYDVEAHPEDSQSNEDQCCQKDFHKNSISIPQLRFNALENEFRADRLVVANLADDSRECPGH